MAGRVALATGPQAPGVHAPGGAAPFTPVAQNEGPPYLWVEHRSPQALVDVGGTAAAAGAERWVLLVRFSINLGKRDAHHAPVS